MVPTSNSLSNSNELLVNNPPNTLPTPIDTINITQSQLYSTPHIDMSRRNALSSSNTTNTNDNSTPSIPPSLVRLHHMYQTDYVLDAYCQPITQSLTTPQDVCKFNRDCIVAKNKTLSKAPNLPDKSPTVFGRVSGNTKKNNYSIVDTRLVSCFNPLCKNTKTKQPKTFHHVCFMHMISNSSKEEMDLLYYTGVHDKLIPHMDKSINMVEVNNFFQSDQTNLMFPFCGKRCYNSLYQVRNKTTKSDDSEYASIQNWEKDGSDTSRSSMMVLIDWLSTQENCSSYFGGLDSNGNTSANRKETYHHHIRNLIMKENGK